MPGTLTHLDASWVKFGGESGGGGVLRGGYRVCRAVLTTGAVLAMKPEATAIGDPQDGRWKITLTFYGRRFCIPKFRHSTLEKTTRQ